MRFTLILYIPDNMFPAIAWSQPVSSCATFVISLGWLGCPYVNIGSRNTKSALTFLQRKQCFVIPWDKT